MGIQYQQINVRLPKGLIAAIREYCRKEGMQQSHFIRQAIVDKIPVQSS